MEAKEVVVTLGKWVDKTHFNLIPFGDLQVGSPLFCRKTWDDYVRAVQSQKNVLTIGMGDYADHFRPSVQERLQGAIRGYDRDSLRSMEEMHRDFIDRKVLPLLKPVVKGSTCLGLLAGHHDMDYQDGTNSTQYLCRELGVPYLGRGEAMVRVGLRFNKTRQLDFDIWASHGDGGGQSVGTPVLKLQKILAHFDVDIALRGHSCDKFIFQEPQFYLSRTNPPRLRERNRIIANTGGFSRSRVEGEATYVEKANMIPKALGWVEIHIHVRREEYPGMRKGKGTHYLAMGD